MHTSFSPLHSSKGIVRFWHHSSPGRLLMMRRPTYHRNNWTTEGTFFANKADILHLNFSFNQLLFQLALLAIPLILYGKIASKAFKCHCWNPYPNPETCFWSHIRPYQMHDESHIQFIILISKHCKIITHIISKSYPFQSKHSPRIF